MPPNLKKQIQIQHIPQHLLLIQTKRNQNPVFFAKRASSKSFADFPSIVTKGKFPKIFAYITVVIYKKDISSLFVSEITDLAFTSISEPSKATSKASSKGSDIFR